MLKAVDITKKYVTKQGQNPVLDGLCLQVGAGEMCIITGKSGCGKSTLLNVLSCLDTFDSGRLTVCGKSVNDMTHRGVEKLRRNDTAFIFQGYNLISSLTAVQNVELGLKYRGINRTARAKMARNALGQVDLAHRTDYLPHQLSGGQQQRVAIARALVLRPKLLFCDEPTGNLDAANTALVLDKIEQLKKQGTAVVMITHEMSLLPMADNVWTLREGRLHRG